MLDKPRPVDAVGLSSAHDGDLPARGSESSSSSSSLSVLRERVEQWAAQIDHAILTMPAPVEARALLVERVNLLRDVLLLLVERETPHQQEKKQGETRVDEGQSNTPRSGSTATSNPT